jgi:hypothetical protein
MSKNFPFIEVPEHLLDILGQPDPGTRLYRAYGSEDQCAKWFETVLEVCQGQSAVSPGGVSMYVRVSRAGVHKRLKEGRLTGFLFHVTKDSRFFKDKKKLEHGGRPYGFIPVIECKAWAEELKGRKSREEIEKEAIGDGDYDGAFLDAPKDWNKKNTRRKQ